jgi:hypothetical protein
MKAHATRQVPARPTHNARYILTSRGGFVDMQPVSGGRKCKLLELVCTSGHSADSPGYGAAVGTV